MTQLFRIHSKNPQSRLISQAVKILMDGGVIAYPTDSTYALGCKIANKEALERIQQIRNLDKKHNFTLVCHDLSELGTYARVDNAAFRLLKAYTPGPYTFILAATHEVPRRLQNPKRKTIGLRIPDHKITLALLAAFNEPILSVTLIMPGDELPLVDADEIYQRLSGKVDLVIDGGVCGTALTTVVDLLDEAPKLIREGKGTSMFFV